MTKDLPSTNLVVYADDDHDDIELVEEAFRQYASNVEVLTFSNGSEALSFFKDSSEGDPLPCLIILDINMPMINGKEVLIRLRQMERYQRTPVVLFTTSSMPVDKSFAQRYNAGFVTKPLGFEQMRIIAEEFMAHCTEETQRKIRR